MSTTARVGSFALAVAVVAGAATALGAAVGPVEVSREQHRRDHAKPGTGDQASGGRGHQEPVAPGAVAGPDLPGGLSVSQDGYALELVEDRLAQPGEKQLRFRVTGPTGEVVTAYEESHGKELHLIVVRRDLSGYQHLHPTRADTGTWTVPVTLPEPGEYRVFADFRARGAERGYTLGHDLSVAGDYRPRPLPATSRTSRVDGYSVRLDGDLVPGALSRLTLVVMRGGLPVTELQPYLGAYGHLVALRDGDVGYLHVHPDGEPGDGRTSSGPAIAFDAEVPSNGDFRLFFDFRHRGRVRTAAFTVSAGAVTRADDPAAPAEAAEPSERADVVPQADQPAEDAHSH